MRKNFCRALTVSALAAALVGCGGDGSGGPVNSEASTETSLITVARDAISWAKKITRSRNQQWERTMPLPALVFQIAARESERLDAVEGWGDPQVTRIACSLASGAMTGEKIRADNGVEGEELEALKRESLAIRALLEGDVEKASNYCLIGRLKAFSTPVNGWPRGTDDTTYAVGVIESFSGLPELVGRVVQEVKGVGDGVAQNELEAAVLQAISTHAPMYWAITREKVAQSTSGQRAGITKDYSGKSPSPVHFTSAGVDYQGGPQGWMITQYGVPWLSGTHVLGTAVSLAVNIRQSASMENSSTSENTRDGTAIDRNSQNVEVR